MSKIRPLNRNRKIILHNPKNDKKQRLYIFPQKIADRLKEYIRTKNIDNNQRIFPLTYGGAREIVKRAGRTSGIKLKCHDLRRHAATYASRSKYT